VNIFIVGMKRSGTTILFDCLYEDKRLDCYYEPFCHPKTNIGGGSGERNIKYQDKLNDARRDFIIQQNLNIPLEYFNLGAPTDVRKELEEEIPSGHKDYLKFLASKSEHSLFKFVRLSHKLKDLKETFPSAKVIHIVKSPRRIAMSHIFGNIRKKLGSVQKLKQTIRLTLDSKFFFTIKSGFDNWSMERMINHLIETDQVYSSYKDSPAYEKIILLWKILNEKMSEDGKKYFGDDYFSLWHENLCYNPEHALESIYDSLGLSFPDEVKEWAYNHINPPRPVFKENDERWFNSANKIGVYLNTITF